MGESTQNLGLIQWAPTDEKLQTWLDYNSNLGVLDDKLKEKPYLEVSKSDVPAISPNAWVKLFPNVTKENTGGGTWASGAYTVPSAGNYLIYFSTKLASVASGAAQFSAVYLNGVLKDENRVEQRQNAGTIDDTMVGMVMIKLAVNDKLEFYVYHTDSVARNLNYSYIRLQKIS